MTLLPSKLVAVALATALAALVACANDATKPSHAKRKPDASAASANPHQADGGRDASATGSADSGPHDGGSASSDRLDGDVPTIEVEVTVRENPQNPLSVFVEWQTSSEGTTSVRVECDEDFGYEVVGSGKRRQHRAYLQGFWEGARCDVRVRSELDANVVDASVVEAGVVDGAASFEIAPLSVELPELVVDVFQPERVQAGWTLFDLTGVHVARPIRFVVVDERGRYRWFHLRAGSTGRASGNDVQVVEEGVLLGGAGWVGVMPAIVRWDGELVWEGDVDQHHDIRLFPDDDHFTFLSVDPDCPVVRSHRVSTINRRSGMVTWDWRHCEHFLPDPPFEDWSHLNAVEPFPDGQALLISSRHQSALFKIDVASSEIEWLLGFPPRAYEPSDIPVIEMPTRDRFTWQHAPEIQDNGNILLFDNGNSSRGYSRVLEIAVDESQRRARAVWEYRHEPDVYAGQWGDADRLSNGNVLSVWGQQSGTEASRIVEVDPDATPVWELTTPIDWGIYRASRIAPGDMPNGYLVEP